MSRLPPLGVSACFRQALSAVHSLPVNTYGPANIIDGSTGLFLTTSPATKQRSPVLPRMIVHDFGVRNATLGQMAGKLLPCT